jgi:glycosyltransferase involved in cell wall biosynthesis
MNLELLKDAMKVAMIGAKGIPANVGGIERHVEELSTRLSERDISVTVYSRAWYTQRAPWSEVRYRGVRVIAIPSLFTKHLDAVSHTLLSTIHAMRERSDTYHFHGVGPSLLAWIPRVFRPQARVVCTFHCIDRRHAKWGRFARFALFMGEWASCIFPHETVTIGESVKEYCQKRFRRDTTCIPNGAPVISRVPRAAASEALAQFGITSKRYLLVVTRLVPHKNVHTVIAAYRQLKREREDCADLQLVIVGAPSYTDVYDTALRAQAAGDPAIFFLGQRSGGFLSALYEHCFAFVHASKSEGMPIVVLEAMAAGAVPLLSDIPEHRTVISKTGGFLFRVGDAWDLALKLEVLLESANSLPELGVQIREAVHRHFNWDDIASSVIDRYRKFTPDTPKTKAPQLSFVFPSS